MCPIVVSISCITYNHAKYIRQCLEGFLMQKTNFEFEILIHDDASTDGTTEIIKEYQEKFPHKIKPIIQQVNQFSKGKRGFNAKYNFSRAQGRYIALCEGDDYWTDPFKLQKQVDFLENNDEFIICFHDTTVVDENGQLVSKSRIKNRSSVREPLELVLGAHLPTSTVLFRNSIEEYPEGYETVMNGDTFLWAVLGQYGKGYFLDNIKSSIYRKQSGGIWSNASSIKKLESSYHTYYTIYKIIDPKFKKGVLKKALGRAIKITKKNFPNNLKNSVKWSCISIKHFYDYIKL